MRVRDRAAAAEFYDALLGALGGVRRVGEEWTAWQLTPDQWFGIIDDVAPVPGTMRIAFNAPSRGTVDTIVTLLPIIGALAIEPPEGDYAGSYYACFFTDPDGNALEVVHVSTSGN